MTSLLGGLNPDTSSVRQTFKENFRIYYCGKSYGCWGHRIASGIVMGTNLKQNGKDYGRTLMKVETSIKRCSWLIIGILKFFYNNVKGHFLNETKHIESQLLRPICLLYKHWQSRMGTNTLKNKTAPLRVKRKIISMVYLLTTLTI